MSCINIIFPNQLFEKNFSISNGFKTYLIEEHLFFKQYNFHKQKIFFHRSSMKSYEDFLINKGVEVIYVDSNNENSDVRNFLNNTKISKINIYHPEDNWLENRIKETCQINKIEIKIYENPLFLTSRDSLLPFFNPEKKKLFQTSFYKNQRKKLNILINEYDKPTGGKWTYDDMNRKKISKK